MRNPGDPDAPDGSSVVRHLVAHLPDELRSYVEQQAESGEGPVLDRLRHAFGRATRSVQPGPKGVKVHAGAARLATGRGVLYPARTGAGKSTLSLALAIERGAAVVSDDLVVFEGTRAWGFGAPIAVRRSSPIWAHVEGLWYAGGGERMLVRPDDVGGDVERSVDVDVIIYPEFGERYSLRSLTPAEGFARICSMVMSPTGDDILLDLARLTVRASCWVAEYSSVDEVLRAVDVAAAESASTSPPLPVPTLVPEQEIVAADRCEMRGVRFGDEVVVIHQRRRQAVHLAGWPAGTTVQLPSWSKLVGSPHVGR